MGILDVSLQRNQGLGLFLVRMIVGISANLFFIFIIEQNLDKLLKREYRLRKGVGLLFILFSIVIFLSYSLEIVTNKILNDWKLTVIFVDVGFLYLGGKYFNIGN